MPGLSEILSYIFAVLRIMRNDPNGFDDLDISADGFWRSFSAILVCLPAFVISWMSFQVNFTSVDGGGANSNAWFFVVMAFSDIANWIVPIVILGLASSTLNIAQYFARIVIATNWYGIIISYAGAFPLAIGLLLPDIRDMTSILSLVIFIASIYYHVRIVRIGLDGQGLLAAGITAAMVVFSLFMSELTLGLI